MPASGPSREILCAKCLRLFSSAQSSGGRCPNCGEPLPPEPPPLPPPAVPTPVPKPNYALDVVLGAVVLVIFAVFVGHWAGGRHMMAVVLFLPLFASCYVLSALMLRNSFARVLAATLMSLAIAAALVGMFFAGCALILKGFNQ